MHRGTVLSERAINVVETLARGPAGIERPDLARKAGISGPTLQRAISELRKEGWVGPHFSGEDPLRMEGPLRLTRRAGILVGLDVGRCHARVAVSDLHGNLLTKPVEPQQAVNVERSGTALLEMISI